MSRPRAALVTLGCMKNRVDSQLMEEKLVRAGWEVIQMDDDDPEAASPRLPLEAVIINTCTFILPAREEAIETILEWGRLREAGSVKRLVVSGCLPQRYGRELLEEIPEVDALLGTSGLDRVVDVVAGEPGSPEISIGGPGHDYSDPDRAAYARPPVGVVKIAGGCSRACSFCVIPQVRGPYQSRPPELIKRDAAWLLEQGCREINLVAQDSTRYGRDLNPPTSLVRLLEELAGLRGRFWLRVLYTYPRAVGSDLLDLMASGWPLVPYLDIPVQHMSDRVLSAMNRPETRESNLRLLEEAKTRGLFTRGSFIVGFPGETAADFSQVEECLERGLFNYAGVFAYSPEEGTPAERLDLPLVPSEVVRERMERALVAWERGAGRVHQELVGREIPLLVENQAEGWGRHWGQAPEVDGFTFADGGWPVGFHRGVITAASGRDFWARPKGPFGKTSTR